MRRSRTIASGALRVASSASQRQCRSRPPGRKQRIGLTKPFWRAGETNFPGCRKRPETDIAYQGPDQQRSSIMWAIIINLIYGQACEKYLADLVRHRHSWI
jgi:hypothetical protein